MLPWRSLLGKDSIAQERSEGRATCTKTVRCPRLAKCGLVITSLRPRFWAEVHRKSQKLTRELGGQDRLEILGLNGVDTFDTKHVLFKGRTRLVKNPSEPLESLFLGDDTKSILDQIQRERPFILKWARSATTVSPLELRFRLWISCQSLSRGPALKRTDSVSVDVLYDNG